MRWMTGVGVPAVSTTGATGAKGSFNHGKKRVSPELRVYRFGRFVAYTSDKRLSRDVYLYPFGRFLSMHSEKRLSPDVYVYRLRRDSFLPG
jgi:hypothetical protein